MEVLALVVHHVVHHVGPTVATGDQFYMRDFFHHWKLLTFNQ